MATPPEPGPKDPLTKMKCRFSLILLLTLTAALVAEVPAARAQDGEPPPISVDDVYIGIGPLSSTIRACLKAKGSIETCDPRIFDQSNPEGLGGFSSHAWAQIEEALDQARIAGLRDLIQFTIPLSDHPSWFAELGSHLGGFIITLERLLRDPAKLATELAMQNDHPGVWVRHAFQPTLRMKGGWRPQSLLGVTLRDFFASVIPEARWSVFMTRRHELKQVYPHTLLGELKKDLALIAQTPGKYFDLRKGIPDNDLLPGEALEIDVTLALTQTLGPVPQLSGAFQLLSFATISAGAGAGWSATEVLKHWRCTMEYKGEGKWRVLFDSVTGYKHGPYAEVGPILDIFTFTEGPRIARIAQTWSRNTENLTEVEVDTHQDGVSEALRKAALLGAPSELLGKEGREERKKLAGVKRVLDESLSSRRTEHIFKFISWMRAGGRNEVDLDRTRYQDDGQTVSGKFGAKLAEGYAVGEGPHASFAAHFGVITDKKAAAKRSVRVRLAFSGEHAQRNEVFERVRAARVMRPALDSLAEPIIAKELAEAEAMAPHATLQHLRTEVDVVFDPLALAALTTPGAGAEFYTAWARTVYPHLALPSDWDLKDESGRLGWLNGVATQGDSYLRRRLAGATQVLAVLRQAETVLAGPPATQDKRTEDLGKKLLKAARKGESHGDLYAFAALAAMPSVQPHVYAAMQLRVTRADKDTTVSIGGPGAAFQPPVESGSAFTQ